MKRRILAVLACMLMLTILCTMVAFAEETGDGDGLLWDLWALLKPENVNYLQVFSILITTIVTMVRMFSGGGLKDLWTLLVNAIKNLIPSK